MDESLNLDSAQTKLCACGWEFFTVDPAATECLSCECKRTGKTYLLKNGDEVTPVFVN